jgi:acyl-CoA dehydrogenase
MKEIPMNFFESDRHFKRLIEKKLDQDFYRWAKPKLEEFGERCATEIDRRAAYTDREGQPKLIPYDRMGNEVYEVWVNEGYKQTVKETYDRGIVGYVHKEIPDLNQKGNYLYSYAQGYLLSQTEPGFYCPVTLSMATAFLLDHYANENVKDRFLPHVLSTGEIELYEGATFLTERQGGSDVGANETIAVKEGENYRLTGEKYFASNSGMCGVAMVLARIEGATTGTKGLSLFAVPWRKEDKSLNGIRIRRLKDKLGVRAVPSAEVEFQSAEAFLVGDPAKGIAYMMEALNLSRLCNAIASIGIMRRAYSEARDYAFKRDAFGHKLANYPMIQDSLVKLAVKQEVETSSVFRLVELFDHVMKSEDHSQQEIGMNRLLIALLKKETAEQSIHFAHEAIEMHGGNGYIEDFVTSRLLRDSQVLTVWEGTANILGLEILRLMHKFQVHEIFIRQMKEELSELSPNLESLKKPVEMGLDKIARLAHHILSSNQDVQTFHSKKMAELMVLVFESVVVLEEASTGGKRDLVKAELYLEETWELQRLINQDMKSLKYFEMIVNG